MKKLLTLAAALSLAALAGCGNPSTSGGKGSRATELKVSGPSSTTTVKHGAKGVVKIKVTRGKDLKTPVALAAELENKEAPGVRVSIDPKTLTADQDEADLTFHAGDKAAKGDYKVLVTATPESGAAAKTEITFKVPEKQ